MEAPGPGLAEPGLAEPVEALAPVDVVTLVEAVEAEAARAVVARLQAHTLLFVPPSLGLVGSIPSGAAAVADDLRDAADGVEPGSVLGVSLRELRGACHDLRARAEGPTHIWSQMADAAGLLALGTFRGIVASNVARWQATYGLEVDEPLASILPSPEPPVEPAAPNEPEEDTE